MPETEAVSRRFQGHLIRLGALYLVLSIIPALAGAFDLTVVPEYAIATHVGTLVMGVLFLCLGLAWYEFDCETIEPDHPFVWGLLVGSPALVTVWFLFGPLGVFVGLVLLLVLLAPLLSERLDLGTIGLEHVAFIALLLAALTVFATGTITALMGVGGETLSAFDPAARGGASIERTVEWLAGSAGMLFFLGLSLLGLRLFALSDQELEYLKETESLEETGGIGSSVVRLLKRRKFKQFWILLWLHLKPLPASVDRAFFRIGMGTMIAAVLALTLQGVRGWRFISVAGYATVGITAIVFMALGLVWPRLVSAAEARLRVALVGIGFEEGCATRAAMAARGKAMEVASTSRQSGPIRGAAEGKLEEFRGCLGGGFDLGHRRVQEALNLLATSVLESVGKARLTYPTLIAAGVLNGVAVLLAALGHLHADPLAVVPAGVTRLLADCLGPPGECGGPFRVKALATIALGLNSIGIIIFAHAVHDSSVRSVPEDMRQKLASRLTRFGVLALAVGFLSAWLPEFSRVPRVGVGTYATLLIIGPMFICFGLVWQPARQKQKPIERVQLSFRKQRATVTALILGTFLLVATGMVLALIAIGGTTLDISAQGAVGSDVQELVAKIFVDTAILLVAAGMILFWIGVRPERRTLRNRITWATTIVAFAVILQAAFYHMYLNYRLTGRYPIRLADYSSGSERGEADGSSVSESGGVGSDPVVRLCDGQAPVGADCESAQNWTADDWRWFYHASQGGAFEVPIPYEWLLALERPTASFWPSREVGLLMDPAYLQRFGFLTDAGTGYDPEALSVNQGYVARYLNSVAGHGEAAVGQEVSANPSADFSPTFRQDDLGTLPVGFARTEYWVDQSSGEMVDVMGFTCAACHTSQIDFKVDPDSVDFEVGPDSVARLRIEGGPANVDLGRFRRAVGVSLYLTDFVPGRFDRFADRLEEAKLERRTRLQEEVGVQRRERRRLQSQRETLEEDGQGSPEARRPGQTVDSLTATVDALTGKIDSLDVRILSLDASVAALNGEIEDPESRRRLREEFDALVQRMRDVRTLQRDLAIYPTEEGFGRLDALGRIFNFVFGSDLDDPGNLGVADAPVNFPHLWDASRFEWVQYTASFHQPMIRNAGQSMGVFASVDMKGAGPAVAVPDDPKLFTSSIDVLKVHEMELLLGGCVAQGAERPAGLEEEGCRDPSFEGLKSPEWPEDIDRFGRINQERAQQGKELYLDRCAGCHLPPPRDELDPDTIWLAGDTTAWTPSDRNGNRFLDLRTIALDEIGTDPRTAINFASRYVDLGELGDRLGLPEDSMQDAGLMEGGHVIQLADSMRAAEALATLIDTVLHRRYRDYGIGDTRRDTLLMNILEGYREPGHQIVLGYRARPLNGVWATAPYLHNGSVPTLYHLLSPQSERPTRFFLGSRMFDFERVGFDYWTDDPGYFEFDTTQPGNSNLGHSFEGTAADWRGRPGVLGPELSPEERMRIIEYLKSMGPLPVRPDFGGSVGP